MKGTPTWFMLSNKKVIEGYIDPYSADAYLHGTPCDIIGTVMLLPEEVRVDDCIIKLVLTDSYEVCPN